MDSSTALYLFASSFIALALSITFIGVIISLKYGKRPDGWSFGVSFVLFILTSAATLGGLYQLESVFYYPEDNGGVYTGLILWYMFLYWIGQPWLVKHFRQHPQG